MFCDKFHPVFYVMSERVGDSIPEKLTSKNKERYIKQLERAKLTEERVKIFSTWMDSYGLDGIIGVILPGLGDGASSIISSLYLLYEGYRLGFSTKESLKILGYQFADFTFGLIPGLGDISDFFFKGNKYSAKLFSDHFKKLEKEAIKKGVSKSEIDNLIKRKTVFQEFIHKK